MKRNLIDVSGIPPHTPIDRLSDPPTLSPPQWDAEFSIPYKKFDPLPNSIKASRERERERERERKGKTRGRLMGKNN